MADHDYLFRIVMVGDSGVGKTNLLSRYTVNDFNFETKTTIGAQFSNKVIPIDSHQVQLQIWDTAGQERYHSITSAYFRGASGALLVYDVCSTESFQSTEKWIKSLKELAEPDVVIVLVGNKSDLVNLKTVSCEDAQEFALKHSVEFIETSALNGQNVFVAFESLAKKIYFLKGEKNIKSKKDNPVYRENKSDSYKLLFPEKNKKKSCC
jgi:Ras-related protein Rab-11A